MSSARRPSRRPRPTLVLVLALVVATVGMGMANAEPIVTRNVAYATRDGETLRLDVYRSSNARRDPVLLLVHGGSWRRKSKEIWSSLAPRFADAGFVVFAINYRLAPPGGETRFPVPPRDVVSAIEWARARAAVYGGDPNKIAVIGSSAGAHLALLAAGAEQVRPDAVVLYSAPVELGRLHRADILRGAIENFIGCDPGSCPGAYREASGVKAIDRASPPLLVAFSKRELIPRRQAVILMRRLRQKGRPYERLELPGRRHGMAVATAVFDETVRFLDRRL